MIYVAKNFDDILGMKGVSEATLKNHFVLYQGYVANTNKLLDELSVLAKDAKTGTPAYAELKRRFGWEFNGMRLHEYYFSAMSKKPSPIDRKSQLFRKIVEDFGSYENWEKDFRATALVRGIGWAILYYDQISKRLLNVWVNEHDSGHLTGLTPILVADMFEHAFILDYSLKKSDYLDAFFNSIDWHVVSSRFS